jgi:hypothetical protein
MRVTVRGEEGRECEEGQERDDICLRLELQHRYAAAVAVTKTQGRLWTPPTLSPSRARLRYAGRGR